MSDETEFQRGFRAGWDECMTVHAALAQEGPLLSKLPTVEDLAAGMWEETHDGRWDDPYNAGKETRNIYRGDAEKALQMVREALSTPDTTKPEKDESPGYTQYTKFRP